MLIDITPLKISRDYRLLFFGQLISFFGSMMTFIVVPWQMFQLTKSSEMVGYLYLAEFVPMFCLAFVGGALADALDKRKMLRLTEIGQTIVTTILLANSLLARPQIWVLFVAVAIHAGLAAIQRPAFESLIQKIIPNDLMAAVMALNSIRYSVGAIVSPAIAGIIATQLSASIAYTIDLVTFTASLIAVFAISVVPPPENAERPSWQSIKNGWKYAFSRQELLGTYLIDIAAMFFAMPQALYPALATIYGERYVGFFPAALASGALLARRHFGLDEKYSQTRFVRFDCRRFVGRGDYFFRLDGQYRVRAVVFGFSRIFRYDFRHFSRLDLESNDSESVARTAGEHRNDFISDRTDARKRENGNCRRTLRTQNRARFGRRSVRGVRRSFSFIFAEIYQIRRTRRYQTKRN